MLNLSIILEDKVSTRKEFVWYSSYVGSSQEESLNERQTTVRNEKKTEKQLPDA